MIDEDDDLQAALDAALRDTGAVSDRAKGVTHPSQAGDEGDESEMTSIMGPEERQLLQQATRRGQEAAASEFMRDDESARPTARPPSSGSEQPVLIMGDPGIPKVSISGEPSEDGKESVGSVLPRVPQPSRPARQVPLDWSVVAFILLAAAALFAVQR